MIAVKPDVADHSRHTVKQASRLLQVTEMTIRRWVADPRIKATGYLTQRGQLMLTGRDLKLMWNYKYN